MNTPSFDPNLLSSFHAVAEQGSISGAAAHLNLTQPAISIQIKNLEEQLGTDLFNRHNRGLSLTPFGKTLLHKTRLLLKEYSEIENQAKGYNHSTEGTLKIGTYSTLSSYLLPDTLSRYFKKFPKVSLQYDYRRTDIILDSLFENELDCALLSEAPLDSRLHREKLFRDKLILVSAPSLNVPKQITAQELAQYPFLLYPSPKEACYQKIDRLFGKHIKKCLTPITSESFDTLKQSILQGIGLSFMPRYMVKKELKSRELKVSTIGSSNISVEFSLLTKKNSPVRNILKEFRDHLKNSFKTNV